MTCSREHFLSACIDVVLLALVTAHAWLDVSSILEVFDSADLDPDASGGYWELIGFQVYTKCHITLDLSD